MDRGSIVSGRFRVEGRQAAGGMGEIHLAVDLQTSRKVAIKVLRWHDQAADARFAREAAVLAELSHPHIVRYIAHGQTPAGDAFLAMEWIDGELLSDKVKRGPLGIDETVALGIQVADALAAAHQRHIVHRDVKPANLLCEDGALDRMKLLDFGLARNDAASLLGVTRSGELAGTPGYMAPEQARGLHDVDARADVYSLGCVLFECLTGRPLFTGEHVFAVLAKILVEEAPRVAELRPDVPPALDELVARMLAKEPSSRPDDAAALLLELRGLGTARLPATAVAPRARALGRVEQRVHGVILAARDLRGPDDATAKTLSARTEHSQHLALHAAVSSYGGKLERLAGGSVLVIIGGAGSATDLAARAGRCALAVAQHLPGMQVALATGRGVASERLPVGEAIDAAASLIARSASEPPELAGFEVEVSPDAGTPIARAPVLRQPVRVDEITAGLLDARFELGVADGGILLLGYAEHREGERTLLGKPTPFVGRERELATLLGVHAECHAEPLAQAVLVTAPAGAGKSRLRTELVRRLRAGVTPVQVWIGRGDPMSAGAPLSMLAQMIRREAGILHGEPPRQSRRKLHARVGRHVPAAEVDRVSDFLGELCGVPFSDGHSEQLRAARRDAQVMGDQLRRAFEDLVAAECGAGPLLLVLEDLHWGDLPTVKFIDATLRSQARRPLMVLALARPEVHELFPELWSGRDLQVIALRPLTERAARKLIEDTLGTSASDTLVRRITEQAGGNAFYLEELIRAAAVGEQNPGTVLAMIGARLEALPAELRRLLRAASVLGESFWPGALRALVAREDAWLDASLAQLVEEEWLVRRADSPHAGTVEHVFRHALVREAAYAMLTPEDRQLGHRLAAEWLAECGETDAMTIGDHLERGGEPARAAGWYARAARQALDGTDLDAAIARARRGLACAGAGGDPGAEELGPLRAVLAEAYTYGGDNAEAERDGLAALTLLPAAQAAWLTSASQVIQAAGRLGHVDRLEALAEQVRGLGTDDASAPAWVRAATMACERLLMLGRRPELVDALLARAAELLAHARTVDPTLPARVQLASSLRQASHGDLAALLANQHAAAADLERLGDRRRACVARHDSGFCCLRLGAWERGERTLTEVLVDAEQLGMVGLASTARQNLGLALARRGSLAEAERLERLSIAELAARGDRRLEVGSRQYLALVLLLGGDVAGAEAEIRGALALEPPGTSTGAECGALLAETLLRQGKDGEALAAARAAMDTLLSLRGFHTEGEAQVRLSFAEALHRSGDVDGARAVIASARARLLELAALNSDAELRACFLGQVPENARTLALADEWGV